ncbi:hypothetical protein [Brevibacillus laterosporus]|uniref:hypothetical protein n=1 Tax=Brevibacillus laterosporus TaxID=1465 RepID=UPI00264AFA4E|nr:hypothetical protein [Brevibacillus laterosporus]MDN9011469.1 hypothetical protein [Brevibacillus laterosporus]MDO0942898.1 hypothetical protein [Brevibacillus laterosporus]
MNWYPSKIFIILFDLLERVINLLSLCYKEGLTSGDETTIAIYDKVNNGITLEEKGNKAVNTTFKAF